MTFKLASFDNKSSNISLHDLASVIEIQSSVDVFAGIFAIKRCTSVTDTCLKPLKTVGL